MSFVLRFGNMPIIANSYNKTYSASSLFANGAAVYHDVINKGNNAETSSYIITHGLDMGVLDINSWSSQHNKLFSGVLKSTNVLQPDTIIEYGCTGKTTVGGADKAMFAYLANPVLSLPQTQAGDCNRNGYRVYGLGVACYSDALGANLSGIFIAYVAIDLSLPEERRLPWFFESSFEHSIISVAWLQSHGYSISFTSSDDDYGDESSEDGYGIDGTPDFDHSSDVIGVPSDPTVSTGTVGFMNVYSVGQGALSGLGEYLFPEIDPSQWTDVTQVLRGIAGIFAYRDSIQYVVDLHAIPVKPTTGTSKYIKLGALETDISQPVCSSDYVNFDCGTVSIPERFRNFLDYTEVKCKIFIPFVGFIDLKPEYWASGSISLKYKFNVIDGSFMAYLVSTSSKSKLANTLIGQYSGSACLHLPVVAASYGAIVSGLISGSAAMATAGLDGKTTPGNVSGVMEGAMTAGNFQPAMKQSNDYNCSAAYLGCREAYLLIEYPVQSFSANYPHDSGLPANVTRTIQSMIGSGYTVIENIDLSGLDITETEIAELKDIFAGGFYL